MLHFEKFHDRIKIHPLDTNSAGHLVALLFVCGLRGFFGRVVLFGRAFIITQIKKFPLVFFDFFFAVSSGANL